MENEEFILRVSETVPDRPSNSSKEQTCPECGRPFFIINVTLWAYKTIIDGRTVWFCRYNCMRFAEKKLENANAGRKKELKSKPSKEVLECNLRAGLPIAAIAKMHESSMQSVHNWIKSYSLAGIQGVKKPKEEIPELIIPLQPSPTLAEIEQFHTDNPVQELPKVKMDVTSMIDEELDRIPSTVAVQLAAPHCESITAEPDPIVEETLEGIWWNVEANMMAAQRKYVEQADKEFRAHLVDLILAVTNGKGLTI
jgi:hypothetical protein